ncbi:MAG: YraN family protein [Acidimicrobiales bacterium]
MTTPRRALGRAGEDAAAAWYEENGYEVLARNWHCRLGEIDLIARRARTVVFCEVKARTSTAFGAPIEAVTREKRDRLRRLAARWLADQRSPVGEIRFDVVTVLDGHVEIFPGAF